MFDAGLTPPPTVMRHLLRPHCAGNRALAGALGAVHAPVIQRLRIKPDRRKGYVEATTKEVANVMETRHLTPTERDNLIAELRNNKELAKRVQAEWADLEQHTNLGGLADLYAIGGQLDVLRAKPVRDAGDERQLRDIALLLVKASQQEPPENQAEAMLQRELIASYRSMVGSMSRKANEIALELGARELDLTVSQPEKAAYREDIKQLGVWGGLAEAETAASSVMHISCTIFVLDATGNYQAVDHIGGANPPNGRDLLFRGNHYEMVQGAVAGQAHLPAHIQVATEPDGNCLFEGLLLVRTGVKAPSDSRRLAMIRRLRRQVAHHITDQQIETSMLEVLLSGGSPGLGTGVTRALQARSMTAEDARGFLGDRGLEPPPTGHAFYRSWDDFVSKRKSDAASEATASALQTLEEQADLLPRIKAPELAPEQGLIADRPSEKLEQQKRAETLRTHKTEISPFNKQQVLVTQRGQQYVLDRLGQLVPRMLVRSISPLNYEELKTYKSFWPSSESPVKVPAEAGGAGTAANVIAKPTPELGHVFGKKPSPYLSATTTLEGTVNPKGEAFGESKRKGAKWKPILVTIDLAYIEPVRIRALYTYRGIGYWLLEGYTGNKNDIIKLLSANPKATRDDVHARGASLSLNLSGKEWQALVDVIRTTEVLISGEVPGNAITKHKGSSTAAKGMSKEKGADDASDDDTT